MRTITENQRKMLMMLCASQGIDDELRADLAYQFSNCRTTHVSQLSTAEASEMISRLKANQSRQNTTLDVWRKRLIAAIGEYLRVFGYTENIENIKAVACRAACAADFNKIPLERLRGLYNAFKDKVKSKNRVEDITADIAGMQMVMN